MLLSTERLDDLQLQGLHLIQNPNLYCFTSDAVLLGNFAKPKKGETVIDLCSGSGVVGFLLAGKSQASQIIGVEIQTDLYDMSVRSVQLNGLESRMRMVNGDVKTCAEILGYGKANVVVCNPPYGKRGSALESESYGIAVARHEILLTLAELLVTAKKLLQFKGRLDIVYPVERLTELIELMHENHIEPKLLQFVVPQMGLAPHLVLVEGVYGGNMGVKILPEIVRKNLG